VRKKRVALEFQYLPADVLGLPEWAARALAERPRPASLGGLVMPHELAAFPEPEDRHEPAARTELAAALELELARFRPHVAVLESVRALRSPGACVLVAGQQPALLGGPLYDLYKALHVVVLARALAQRWERPVVPLFWNHADDHDLAEVHHLWIQNPNLDLRKVALAGMSSGRTLLSRIVFEEERHHLGALAELLRQNLWEGPERESALATFLPRAGETFSGAFTRTLLELCGHLGLVVLEPQWLRAPLSRLIARLVASELEPALASGAASVRASGREPAIDPRSAALVFHHVDGKRHALRLADGLYRYDGESGARTASELAAEIVQEPLEWSCGALLRPVVQDLLLPVAGYVGGFGELAYHAQLGALRAHAGAPATPFVARLSATLVDAASRESLAKLGLGVRDVLAARGQLVPEASAAPAPPVVGELRAIAKRAAGELVALRAEAAALDPGLAQQLKRTADQLEDLVDKLAAKLERVQANNAGTGRRHHRRLANGLFPNGAPQERVRGALEFVARHGPGWIDELLAGIDPLPTEHLVVHLPS
jgi:bacillithiol biosynthesis cysteine-adding enzyme BshC